MSKGLEALERIQCKYVYVFKARENGQTQLVHDLNTIKKELKAFEIIKNKKVDTDSIWYLAKNNHKELSFYNDYLNKFKGELPLTQEEYDLLKEVLL